MKEIGADLLAEYSGLASLAETLSHDQWRATTPFYGWTPWDEIAHLCFFDEESLLAVGDPHKFKQNAALIGEQMANGVEISKIARQRYGHLEGAQMLPYWRERYSKLVQALSGLDAKARLPWYGPTMSARSFAAARIMETWAHGQDIYDCLCLERPATDRIKHIAHIGVSTFGWSFANRRLPVPEQPPYVELLAPSGQTWSWNVPSSTDYVRGNAQEFCLVVTQRRHVADTDLISGGENARKWLAIAQCFAGPPVDGPAPGVRKKKYGVGAK